MDFKVEHHYDVSPQRLIEMFERADFWKAKYEALGQQNIEVLACGEVDGNLRIQTRRDAPVNVPSFAKKILSPMNTITQLDDWLPFEGDQRNGSWSLEVQGKPITMSGSMCLTPKGDGCCNTITGTIEVKVRLVGGTIAKFLAGDVLKNLDKEQRFSAQFLAEMDKG